MTACHRLAGCFDTSTGQDILDTVFRHLNLIETSYFGLRYVDCNGQTHWLETSKKVAKQLKGKESFTLYFAVKFYAADPCKLVEEITRYQFFLQVKQDILQGRLPIQFDLLAELGAFAVQSELGDYDHRRHSSGYISEFRFISNQTVELESKVSDLHKELKGQLPSVAELNFLDKVKWLEMYGVDLHPVIGEDNVEYFLGLTPTGVIVLRNKIKVANYYWSTISKIYFKGKYFMLRVCDKNNEENTYGFETPSRAACKHLYKCCKEHHSFFQLVHVTTNAPDVVNTRFSTRLDKISGRSSQLGMRNPPSFIRTPSRRYQRRSIDGSQSNLKIELKGSSKESISREETKSVYATANNATYYVGRSDSPRSTRSAPWGVWGSAGPPRTTHSSHSPRSVRSAGPGPQLRLSHARRSSSMESQSSTDSKPCRRHKHRSKRGSDNESDLSRCSSHGNSHRRHRHRSRKSSGSEQDRHSHHSSHRYQLIDSESQWKEVQRRQAEGSSDVHQANVIRPRSGYVNSGVETESEHSSCHHHRRKHRKHRSRSRSPSDGSKPRLPDELKKHLDFQLVDTDGMSQDQLREIPYTVVKTSAAKAVRVRLSPSGKPKIHTACRTKSNASNKESTGFIEDSPPPPYSESPVLSDLSNKTSTTATTNSDSSKSHQSRLSSQLTKNVNPGIQKNSSSTLYGSQSALLGNQHYLASNPIRNSTNNENTWLKENERLSVGLPPQPQTRKLYSTSSDISLNSSSRSHNQKCWPSPEIRGDPLWSPLSEQIPSSSMNMPLDSRRIDYHNLNQNILEHRSAANVRSLKGSKLENRSFDNRPPDNRSAESRPFDSRPIDNRHRSTENRPFDNRPSENRTFEGRKSYTPAETGVLKRYANTPNGKVAWPNDRQLGWQPKSSQNWNADSSDNLMWTEPSTPNNSLASNQSWPSPKTGPLMFSPQSQMQIINENITAESVADSDSDLLNFINNNPVRSSTDKAQSKMSDESTENAKAVSHTDPNDSSRDTNANSTNDKSNDAKKDGVKRIVQEMSTEL